MSDKAPVVIIGGGLLGLSTPYALAQQLSNKDAASSEDVKRIIVLEQFQIGHNKGSSHGETRIIRKNYAQAHFQALMDEALELWSKLEDDFQQFIAIEHSKNPDSKLIEWTGGFVMGNLDNDYFAGTLQNSVDSSLPIEVFHTTEQLKLRFGESCPMQLPHSGNYAAIYSNDGGGVIRSDYLLQLYVWAFKQNRFPGVSVEIRENCFVPLEHLVFDSSTNCVNVPFQIEEPGSCILKNETTLSASAVVISVGSYVVRLSALAMVPRPITVAYWKRKPFKDETNNTCIDNPFSQTSFPFLIVNPDVGKAPIYGMKSYQHPDWLKICFHDVDNFPETPGSDDGATLRETALQIVQEQIKSFLPDAVEYEAGPVHTETCIYTVTKDENFILDQYQPEKFNGKVILGAGLSGHGFKFGPLLGKILSEKVLSCLDDDNKPAEERELPWFQIKNHLW